MIPVTDITDIIKDRCAIRSLNFFNPITCGSCGFKHTLFAAALTCDKVRCQMGNDCMHYAIQNGNETVYRQDKRSCCETCLGSLQLCNADIDLYRNLEDSKQWANNGDS